MGGLKHKDHSLLECDAVYFYIFKDVVGSSEYKA